MTPRHTRLAASTVAVAVAFALALACERTEEAAEPAADDVESVALALLRTHLFDSIDALRPRFADGLDPGVFPPRLLLDGPSALATARIQIVRVRMLDGRGLVTARLGEASGVSETDFWLERREGLWRVSGFDSTPRAVSSDDVPVPEVLPVPPAALAAAAFRDRLQGAQVPVVRTGGTDATSGRPASAAEVTFRRPTVSGACRPSDFQGALEGRRGPLAACWARHVRSPRGGRVTWRLTRTPDREATDVALVETTVLDAPFVDCTLATLAAVRVPVVNCSVEAAAVFSPRAGQAAE
jgi:hypothetical protein